MTPKQRVCAALEGRPVDRCPVASLYSQLYHLDHFAELTGEPAWRRHAWLHAEPTQHVALLARILERAPLEIVQPQWAVSRATRQRMRFVMRDGVPCRHDLQSGAFTPLDAPTTSGHANDYAANETQHILSADQIETRLPLVTAQAMQADGGMDYVRAAVAQLGADQFILSGGVIGTIYSCGRHVGQSNLLAMLIEQPDFVDTLCRRVTEQNLEIIRLIASAGGDAIYIDDATATMDMISVAHYERFSLPYLRQMVRLIHDLGHKAILIYFGGIADRLEQIASIGADALSCETSMKNYVNDIEAIARRIGSRLSLFGNIDPVGVLEQGSDAELERQVRQQLDAGRPARGFITATGSPITPGTPLARVRAFINLGARLAVRT